MVRTRDKIGVVIGFTIVLTVPISVTGTGSPTQSASGRSSKFTAALHHAQEARAAGTRTVLRSSANEARNSDVSKSE